MAKMTVAGEEMIVNEADIEIKRRPLTERYPGLKPAHELTFIHPENGEIEPVTHEDPVYHVINRTAHIAVPDDQTKAAQGWHAVLSDENGDVLFAGRVETIQITPHEDHFGAVVEADQGRF